MCSVPDPPPPPPSLSLCYIKPCSPCDASDLQQENKGSTEAETRKPISGRVYTTNCSERRAGARCIHVMKCERISTKEQMGKNTSKCILIQTTNYPSNKCINTKYKILVPENVTKYNTCILYLKYRKYLFWIFHFLTIWYSRAFRFGLYNVHKALVNHTWLA